ncbi:DDE-type integrase/transposase/recombinase [Corynebacterium riegelii]|uniref:DDE-type integrase/transposase/recombinase n=1 Tax=Corynebacterium riegelii TaxID=156976 RepID=UPI000A400226|nr:DDE-type integrase/transposase/recombinase [Corynebacterium riegelii]MDK7181545.1 DDE-type integrase/transposase/recombinase [Corynebacterium riegelii]
MCSIGHSKYSACTLLRISRSRRYYQQHPRPKTPAPIAHTDRNITRLSDEQIAQILALLDANPQSSVDDVFYNAYNHGKYIASLSSFYRVARRHGKLLRQRYKTRAKRRRGPTHRQPPCVQATGPAQVLCWDITYLPGPYVNETYACHTAMDLYSRAIVGKVITHHEDSRAASHMFAAIFEKYPTVHTVHSDNGSAMTSKKLAKLFADHCVATSFSRPGISNDNPQMESLFHTMKGVPYYPHHFDDIHHATDWVEQFSHYYNHRPHSGINGYTPQSVLDGTWHTFKNNRSTAIDNALAEGWITTRPTPPTDLPKHVTIIRTSTTPTPQPHTIKYQPKIVHNHLT